MERSDGRNAIWTRDVSPSYGNSNENTKLSFTNVEWSRSLSTLTHNQRGCAAAMGLSLTVSVPSSLGTKNSAILSGFPLAGLLLTKAHTTIPSHRVTRHAGFSPAVMRQHGWRTQQALDLMPEVRKA